MSVDPSTREACVAKTLDTHRDELRRFVRGRVPATEADDILQMAALRALERADALEDPARVRAWLFTIHRNLATDTLRQRARQAQSVELLEAPQTLTDDDLCDCSTVQAGRLRPSYASVLALVDTGGASLAEAARTLGITVNNTTVRLHRARKALREAMLDHCGVGSARDCLDCRCVMDGCCVA